jgi:hypothetical protein
VPGLAPATSVTPAADDRTAETQSDRDKTQRKAIPRKKEVKENDPDAR